MSERKLFGYTGLFNTPDQIINAAEKVSDSGYTKYDVNTPYPIHGMDDAMKLPPSKLGYASLVFGISGTLTALLFMYWMSAIDYPVIVGGKPFFSFPAYIPIMFEVTVLAAAIATVTTMVAVFFKFPNNSHPLHGTDYMRLVSTEKYGLLIEASDPDFDDAKVKSLFAELGADDVQAVYFDEDDRSLFHKALTPKFVGMLVVTAIVTSGTIYFSLNKLMYLPPFNWMQYQEKVSPQTSNTFFEDGRGMRLPVEGTVSRGFMPYQFKGKPELASKMLKNPLLPTKENLEIGNEKYDIYCSPCHGYLGEGDARLNGQFPNPPTIHTDKLRNWSDGSIFHVMTDGQNIMPSYSNQLSREERWATVLYIRALQRSFNAKESDL